MSTIKKLIALMLIICMLFALGCGCADSGSEDTADSSGTAETVDFADSEETSESSETVEEAAYFPLDEPVNISF